MYPWMATTTSKFSRKLWNLFAGFPALQCLLRTKTLAICRESKASYATKGTTGWQSEKSTTSGTTSTPLTWYLLAHNLSVTSCLKPSCPKCRVVAGKYTSSGPQRGNFFPRLILQWPKCHWDQIRFTWMQPKSKHTVKQIHSTSWTSQAKTSKSWITSYRKVWRLGITGARESHKVLVR